MDSQRHPEWLRVPLTTNANNVRLEQLLDALALGTVCQSAHCPNMHECFGCGTASFMILGQQCTRNCRFCAVGNGPPDPVDLQELRRLAQAVKHLGLRYVVVTSVTRDDLEDGGAIHFSKTIQAIRNTCPITKIEVLVPDFKGSLKAMQIVIDAHPDMFNHNIETVPRLYSVARPQASFMRSLSVLQLAAEKGLRVKTGLMLGMGERTKELEQTLEGILPTGCRYLTLGQYLSPSKVHLPVVRYVQLREFDMWAERAKSMGFKEVYSGPLIRSSYRAEKMIA